MDNISSKRILACTGLTGRTGGVLLRELSQNREVIDSMFGGGIRVLLHSDSGAGTIRRFLPDADIVICDLNNDDDVRNALKGVDTVLHISGIVYSENIADSAAENRVRRMIAVHTTGIYSRYKSASEDYIKYEKYVKEKCRQEKIKLTIIRPTMIYGRPDDGNVIVFIKMVDRLPVMPIVSNAMYQLQPVFYEDLGRAYYQILIHEEETANRDYNLSGKEPVYLREMFKIIGEKLGKKVHFFSVPFPVAYTGAVLLWLMSFGKADFRERVQRLCEPRIFDHDDAAAAFGFDPRSFEEGISAEVEEYKMIKKNKH